MGESAKDKLVSMSEKKFEFSKKLRISD